MSSNSHGRVVYRATRTIASFLLLVGAAAFASCSNSKPGAAVSAAASALVPVAAATVVSKPAPIQVRAIGQVEAYSSVQIKAHVAGQVFKVNFQEGQDVKKGDLLFAIDPRPFEDAIKQIQANIARDTALKKQAEATIAKDLAQANYAEVEAARYKKLVEDGVVSREQYEQLRANSQTQRATVEADRATAASAEQEIKADNASLESARLQLSYCTIRAPIDGRTGSLLVHNGDIVKADDAALVVINQIAPIFVTFSVPEKTLPDIRRYNSEKKLAVEASAQGAAEDSSTDSEKGSLSFFDNTVDNATGTIRLKADFDNGERRLWPGQFVDVVVTLTSEPAAVVVPSAAVQTGQNGSYVFVINPDSTVEVRPVAVSRELGGSVGESEGKSGGKSGGESVIENGVRPGETVVTDGQLRLVSGTRVEVRDSIKKEEPGK